ncbi:MAG TPA: PEP-CTERM sorting domain-containing protein [Pirellulales bacterium]
MTRSRMLSSMLSAIALFLSGGVPALAVQYTSLDPGYTQEIYTGPLVGGPGMAWTSTNQLLTRNGSDILEYSFAQNAIHQGTSIHSSIATHSIAGLATSGYGMTNGLDGYVYTITGSGLQRFNPSNWAAPAQTLAGTITGGQGYGITTLPDGRIAYSDGVGGASSVWIYDPVAATNTLIHSGNSLIDGMVAGPTGNIAVTGQDNSTITILSNTGTVINTFSTFHFPDGLAFSAVPGSTSLYSNNNDGTITRYDLGPGFLGTPTYTDIATGSGAYGDLASVGPDCAFYVSQFDNFGFHGSTPGIGTHWDNGTTNNEPSIIRIGGVPAPDGSEVCLFYTPFEHDIPEPGSVVLMSFGIVALAGVAYRRRQLARV